MNKHAFYVASNKTGFVVDGFNTFDDALAAIDRYQAEDFKNGDCRVGMYSIVDEDHIPVHRYMVKVSTDGSTFNYIDVIEANENYTESDYINQHPDVKGTIELEQRI